MSSPQVTLRAARALTAKPPAIEWALDVELNNPTDDVIWFVFGERPGQGQITRLEAIETLAHDQRSWLVLYGDPAGALAIPVAARQRITVSSLPITAFDPSPVDVWASSDVLVGGEPLAALCDAPPWEGTASDAGQSALVAEYEPAEAAPVQWGAAAHFRLTPSA